VSLPQYPEYKDSGHPHISKVPSQWEIKPLKHCLRLITEKATGKSSPIALENIEGWSARYLPSESDFEGVGIAFRQGDILFGKLRPYLAKVYQAEFAGEAIGDFHVMRPVSGFIGRYALYQFLQESFISVVDGATHGAKMPRVGWEFMGNMPFVVPRPEEQLQIARFLSHETAKIDALIREQERLIELLQEKRQAVISHAVTKGLDPDVPMKDSGVQWLGEVPAHWRVGKLRWYATIQGGVAKGKDYQDQKTVSLPYLRVANVQAGYVDLTEVKEIAVLESEIERYSLRHGDVLMNEGGDNDKLGRGTVWRAEIEPCLHQNHVFAIRPNGHLTPEWLAMFTQSSRARSYFFLNSKQSTNLASISSSNVMNLDLPMPSVDEQERILQFLESELQQFTDLQKQADKGIQLLLERRSALISAAVTGKIDVRNWQPPVDESAFDEEVRQAGMEVTA